MNTDDKPLPTVRISMISWKLGLRV